MEIVFVINQMGGVGCGGADRVVSILANELVKKNNRVSIISLIDNGINDRPLVPEVSVIYLPKNSIRNKKVHDVNRIKDSIVLISKEMKRRPNAIFISFVNWASMCTLIARHNKKVPVVISERTDPRSEPHSSMLRKFRDYLYGKADRIVFQTSDARDYFSDEIKKKSQIIPNPIKAGLPVCNYSARKNEVIAVGRLEEQKNYPLLFQAFSEFLKFHKDYVLRIYGQGKLKTHLEDECKKLGVSQSVIMEGFNPNVCDLIADGSMYVISSNFEGMSNSMLEALAIGVPVIATDCPVHAARDLIESYKNGIVVPVNDKKALSEAMCYVADHPSEAEMMGKNAMSIRDKLSIECIVNQWIDILEDIK